MKPYIVSEIRSRDGSVQYQGRPFVVTEVFFQKGFMVDDGGHEEGP